MPRYDNSHPDAANIEVLDDEGNVVDGVFMIDTDEGFIIKFGEMEYDDLAGREKMPRLECPDLPFHKYVAFKMYMVHGDFTVRFKAP